MKEEKIENLFRVIREVKPEVEWSTIEQFVLVQPAAAFVPQGGESSAWLNLKNTFLMISSVSVLGIAIQLMVSHNNPKPAKAAMVPVVDTNQKKIVYSLDADTAPANSVRFGPIAKKKEFVLTPPEAPPKPIPFGCDDEKHIAKDFYDEMVKDKLIDPETFNFKMNDTHLWINGEKQEAVIYSKYMVMLQQKGVKINDQLKIVVRSVKCDCYISINEGERPDANTHQEQDQTIETVMNEVEIAEGDSFELSPFNEVILQNSPYVFVTKGERYSITIEGCQALAKDVTYVKNNQLIIIGTSKKCVMTVKMPENELNKVYLQGSGVIKIDYHFPNVNLLEVKSSGAIIAENGLNAKEISLRVLGSGVIQVHDLKAESTKIDVMGSGMVENTGKSTKLTANVMGSGISDTKGLESESATAIVNGSGLIYVRSKKNLKATVLGSGNITYYGNPKDLKESITGSGSIKKK